jgi:hypothetical protein
MELCMQAAHFLVSRQFGHGLAVAVDPFSERAAIIVPDGIRVELLCAIARKECGQSLFPHDVGANDFHPVHVPAFPLSVMTEG